VARPYVTLERQGDVDTTRTSSGSILATAAVRLSIWDDNLDRAKQIAAKILNHFNRASFTSLQATVLDCKQTNQQELIEPDGVWHVLLDYQVRFVAG
jgi:hypothetical protein